MRIHIVFFIISIIFLSACQEVAIPTQQTEKSSVFFDLKGFFQKEKAYLEKLTDFKKTVSINGVSEEKALKTLNLDNELSIFIASDINRPAWSDKYKIDSIYSSQDQLSSIIYKALDKSMKTKKITINFKNNAASKIEIEKTTDNAVAQTKQFLTYTVGKGYTIQSEQALSLSDTKTIIVNVEYN